MGKDLCYDGNSIANKEGGFTIHSSRNGFYVGAAHASIGILVGMILIVFFLNVDVSRYRLLLAPGLFLFVLYLYQYVRSLEKKAGYPVKVRRVGTISYLSICLLFVIWFFLMY
ncbi:hypothetical protein SAMN04488134_11388 [Amphibacillus marinus]|uniref:DUF4181 domain-containing protein n=1 Tax=Amphibacillus marinus TaxID=872970 RepID=A0A1H8SSX3_9BACI|nr:hypothetical protein [Amphibacillus marinus]SEO81458.1 hypothetical protein SAMN04488134_11388 [Amphibacillus marinus]